jgi:hypothetical protein
MVLQRHYLPAAARFVVADTQNMAMLHPAGIQGSRAVEGGSTGTDTAAVQSAEGRYHCLAVCMCTNTAVGAGAGKSAESAGIVGER